MSIIGLRRRFNRGIVLLLQHCMHVLMAEILHEMRFHFLFISSVHQNLGSWKMGGVRLRGEFFHQCHLFWEDIALSCSMTRQFPRLWCSDTQSIFGRKKYKQRNYSTLFLLVACASAKMFLIRMCTIGRKRTLSLFLSRL